MTREADEAAGRVGSVLNDKWTLERLLGVGGMGAVYAGRHRNGARAAVKVLHRALSRHEEVKARFLREGYAANRVDRPGVVKVLDDDVVVGGPDEGTAYLVMELLEGQSLEERVQGGLCLTERDFLVVADAVLDVLETAHANGVVHRDIKPENLFIAKDEAGIRLKVLDFGLARLLEGQSTTSHGVALGTPSFMSPEQAGGRNDEIDGRTDVFALGACGFRLITGRPIHEGVGPIDRVVKMATLPAPPIRELAPAVSEAFARIIDHALEFRREDRYESAAAMRAEVQAALAAATGTGVRGRAMADDDRSIVLSATDFEVSRPPPAAAVASASTTTPAPTTEAPLPSGDSPPPATRARFPTALGLAPPIDLPPLATAPPAPPIEEPPVATAAPALPIDAPPVATFAPSPPADASPVPKAAPPPPSESPAPAPRSVRDSALSPLESRKTVPMTPLQPEGSLAPIPMGKGTSLRLVVALTVLPILGVLVYAALDRSPDSTATVSEGMRDASEPAHDAPPSDVTAVDAAAVATTPLPRPRAAPNRPPLKPGDPRTKQTKRPKH